MVNIKLLTNIFFGNVTNDTFVVIPLSNLGPLSNPPWSVGRITEFMGPLGRYFLPESNSFWAIPISPQRLAHLIGNMQGASLTQSFLSEFILKKLPFWRLKELSTVLAYCFVNSPFQPGLVLLLYHLLGSGGVILQPLFVTCCCLLLGLVTEWRGIKLRTGLPDLLYMFSRSLFSRCTHTPSRLWGLRVCGSTDNTTKPAPNILSNTFASIESKALQAMGAGKLAQNDTSNRAVSKVLNGPIANHCHFVVGVAA